MFFISLHEVCDACIHKQEALRLSARRINAEGINRQT